MSDLWPAVQAEFRCDHDSTVLTYKDASNGVRAYRYQCTICGQGLRVVKHTEVSPREKSNIGAFDDAIRAGWEKARRARYDELREAEWAREKAERRKGYDAYMKSPEWALLRFKVFQRANGVCEGCGDRRPTEVHHRNYARFGREFLFDLAGVCRDCHQALHATREEDAA